MDHSRDRRPLGVRGEAALALLLTGLAGFVDATGYFLLAHLLTANMSGNTVHLARAIVNGTPPVLRPGWPIAWFVAGLVVCDVLVECATRRTVRSTASIPLTLELLLLLVAAATGAHVETPAGLPLWSLVAVVAGAMGLQNATLSRVGKVSVRTTHVTGTLATFARALTSFGFWLHDEGRAGRGGLLRRAAQEESLRDALFTGGMWTSFLLGALGAAWLAAWGFRALYLPAAVLVPVVLLDLRRPISTHAQRRDAA